MSPNDCEEILLRDFKIANYSGSNHSTGIVQTTHKGVSNGKNPTFLRTDGWTVFNYFGQTRKRPLTADHVMYRMGLRQNPSENTIKIPFGLTIGFCWAKGVMCVLFNTGNVSDDDLRPITVTVNSQWGGMYTFSPVELRRRDIEALYQVYRSENYPIREISHPTTKGKATFEAPEGDILEDVDVIEGERIFQTKKKMKSGNWYRAKIKVNEIGYELTLSRRKEVQSVLTINSLRYRNNVPKRKAWMFFDHIVERLLQVKKPAAQRAASRES